MPDAITIDTLILACAASGQWERALARFAESVAHGLELGIYSHDVLLVACLPHASTRLDLDDAARVALLARRVGAAAMAVALDDGQRILTGPAGGGWRFDGAARVLAPDGMVSTPAAGAEL